MKKFFLSTTILFVIMLFVGCFSTMVGMVGPQKGYESYGHFSWGANLEAIKEKTSWKISEIDKNTYFVGVYTKGFGINNYYPVYYPHGERDSYIIDETRLYFNDNRLYAIEDEFKNTPPTGFLHELYGGFSEENIVTGRQNEQEIETAYRSACYFNNENFYELEILIYKNGKTKVTKRDPFIEKSRTDYLSLCETQIYESKDLITDNWVCYSAIDNNYSSINSTDIKRINFTFLNRNKDGKYLIVGYSKGFEKSGISYVRSGICVREGEKDAAGIYDIKGDTGVVSKKYSIEKWNCTYNGETYYYTTVREETSREILDLLLSSEKVMVRHNNVVSEFVCNGKQLLDKMAEYGITWEEIDNAIANEEF